MISVNDPLYHGIARLLDYTFIFFSFICPIIGDIVLIWKKHLTQKLIITVCDNSPAAVSINDVELGRF